MKSKEERFASMQSALSFLGELHIQPVNPTVCAPYGDDLTMHGFKRVQWAPFIWIGKSPIDKNHELFRKNRIFSIGLASVLTCLQFDLKHGDKVLDLCAAPGIKSLYLQILHDKRLDLYVNDISHARLVRLRTLFESFNVWLPTFSHQMGQSLASTYSKESFDAVIIDAPCSGEGNILRGDEEALQSWSLAKVKRLAAMQRKLIKTGLSLVRHDGQLVYATCTLNVYENENALRKAGIVLESSVNTKIKNSKLRSKTALRLLPSEKSIGFFVAKVK